MTPDSGEEPQQSWREPYEGTCPRCGNALADPDHHLNRTCPNCGITVQAAQVTMEDIPSSTPCDECGQPASWIGNDGTVEWVLCDSCHAKSDPPLCGNCGGHIGTDHRCDDCGTQHNA